MKWLWLSAAVLLVDQVTKQLALIWLAPYERLPVTPFFNLTLVFNPGAAFSFLGDATGWQRWFFTLFAGAVTAILLVWLYRLPRDQPLTAAALGLVIGGAIGNALDRLFYGHVIDFIDFYVGDWHWPAFNVADSAITVGVILLLADAWRSRHAAG